MNQFVTTSRGRARMIAAAVTVLTLSLVAAGCGSADNKDASGGTTSQEQIDAAKALVEQYSKTPTEVPQTVPLKATPATGKKMIYINDPNPANVLTGESIKAAVTAAGWEYENLSYDIGNPASVQSALQTALTKGADYVGEAGTDPNTFGESVLTAYRDAGAKIIAGSVAGAQNNDVVNTDPTSGPDRVNQAKALAAWFIADSNGKGKAVIENVTAFPVLALFATTFKEEVEKGCPGCSVEIMGFDPSALADGSIVPALVSKLRSDPDTKYVFFDYAAFSTGIDSALSAAGLDDVKVGGTGLDENAAEGIRKGTQDAWVAASFPYAGYAIADVAFRLDAGQTDGLTEIQTGPIQLITKNNVDDYQGDYNSWNEPADALQQLQTLWKVSS